MATNLEPESHLNQRSRSKQDVSETAKEILTEFCESTTIHGVKYIGTKPLKEKIWWITVFIISITICCFQIHSIYQKWEKNPVIITFDQNFRSIGEFPFPAVTVCVPLTINGTVFDFGKTMNEIAEEGVEDYDPTLVQLFDLTSRMCLQNVKSKTVHEEVQTLFENYTVSEMKTLLQFPIRVKNASDHIALKLCKGIVAGRWNCSDHFERIDTPEGTCYTFNMLKRETILRKRTVMGFGEKIKSNQTVRNWSPDVGYDSISPVVNLKEATPYPFRTFITETKLDFELHFKKLKNSDPFKCFDKPYVYIHHPHDLPWQENTKISLADLSQAGISVLPEVSLADQSMRDSFSADTRKCYFDDERYLRYFKVYSESNCDLECYSNISQKLCGCVAFWMPRHPSIRTCGVKDFKCFTQKVGGHLKIEKAFTSASNSPNFNGQLFTPFRCNCLPRCNSVVYTFSKDELSEIDTTDDDDGDKKNDFVHLVDSSGNVSTTFAISTRRSQIFDTADEMKSVKMKVSFKKSQVLALKRSPFYQLSDFIANVGGLLGLFIGMSLLSVVEVFYFLTMRLIEKCSSEQTGGDKVDDDDKKL